MFAHWTFWALSAIELVFLLGFVTFSRGALATSSLGLYFVIAYFAFGFNLLTHALSHPVHYIIGIVAYYVLGVLWGIVKWRQFIFRQLEKCEKVWQKFATNNDIPPGLDVENLTDQQKEGWENAKKMSARSGYEYCDRVSFDPPQVSQHKSDIMEWMTFWPISIVVYLFEDVITALWNWIYREIANSFQKMSDRIFNSKSYTRR
jgi:hypothetical protein